jgi:hypothetical protein
MPGRVGVMRWMNDETGFLSAIKQGDRPAAEALS